MSANCILCDRPEAEHPYPAWNDECRFIPHNWRDEALALRARLASLEKERNELIARHDGVIDRATNAEARAEEAERERAEWQKHAKLMEHKVICCGVAASHPDPELSRRPKDYGGKWDSPQAQEVRDLRERADAAEAALTRTREELKAAQAEAALYEGEIIKAQAFFAETMGWLGGDELPLGRIEDLRDERDAALAAAAELRVFIEFVEAQLRDHQPLWEHDHEEDYEECRACTYEAMLRDSRRVLSPPEPSLLSERLKAAGEMAKALEQVSREVEAATLHKWNARLMGLQIAIGEAEEKLVLWRKAGGA